MAGRLKVKTRGLDILSRVTASLFAVFLCAGAPAAQPTANPAPAPSKAEPEPTSESDRRLFTVTVTDGKGRHLVKLRPEAFSAFVDGRATEITHFGEFDQPVSVGFVFDVSGSMTTAYTGREGRASPAEELVARFMERSNGANEYFVMAFNRASELLQDRTRDRQAVLAAVRKLSSFKPLGVTAFYDACYLAVEKAGRGTLSKRAVVIVSDGQDNQSRYTLDELKRLLKEQDVLVYTVGLFSTYTDGMLFQSGLAVLEEMAPATGGKNFLVNHKELPGALDYIADELRRQYVVGFPTPPAVRENKWHTLEVKVAKVRDASGKEVKPHARTRKGFYVPAALP